MNVPDREQRKTQARRLATLLRIVFRLSSAGGLNTADACIEFGVCERTMRRYLNAAEEAGVPYYYDAPNKVLRSRPGWRPSDLS